MRIAMVDNSSGWGGAEQGLSSLATELRGRGHHVGIFLREGSANVSRMMDEGFDVFAIPRHGLKVISGVMRLATIIRREKFDLIHVHRNHDLLAGKAASLSAGVPLLLTQHCQLGNTSPFIMRLADKIVAVSRFIANDMESRFPSLTGCVEVIHNGINLDPFINHGTGYWDSVPEVCDAKPLLGVVGYFYKNQEELIELFPRILEELPKAKLVIIGHDDSKQALLEGKVRECGVVDAVHFAGMIPHDRMADALAGLDLNVSAFRREGFGLNVIEALAVGTPFAGYRAGSYPELVKDGETGMLADNSEDLIHAILSLMLHPEKINEMRRKAREDACVRFSLERMLKDYEMLYRKMINAGDIKA